MYIYIKCRQHDYKRHKTRVLLSYNQSSSNFPDRDTSNAKDAFWSRTFSIICLILATCV